MSWQPPISGKQASIVNDPKRYILVNGPRLSSKSFGVMHRIAWRMWSIPNYIGCIVARTTASATNAGFWATLTEKVIPVWTDADFGFEWEVEPKLQADHKWFFSIRNQAGGVSRMYLDSLDVEEKVEARFKNRSHNDIILSEATNFDFESTFTCLSECLRVSDIPQESHSLILDTNPSVDLGSDHWIYRKWYTFPTIDLDNMTDDAKEELNLTHLEGKEFDAALMSLKELQANMSVHKLTVDDNIFISDQQKRAQFAKYAHDKQLLAAYYYGEWVKRSGNGVFSEVWRPSIHVVGEIKTAANPEPEIMIPEEECIELLGGWDIGSRRNTAAVLIEPIIMEAEEYGELAIVTGYKILDEYVSIGRQQKIWETAEAMLEKVELWEGLCKRPPRYQHISDSSAFSVSGQTNTTEAQDIFRLTEGKIELRSVAEKWLQLNIKGHGGVERGVDLITRLLFENRLWVNAAKCPNVCEMFSSISRNKNNKIATTHPMKHIFDSLRYPISFKSHVEMRRASPRLTTDNAKIVVTRL